MDVDFAYDNFAKHYDSFHEWISKMRIGAFAVKGIYGSTKNSFDSLKKFIFFLFQIMGTGIVIEENI